MGQQLSSTDLIINPDGSIYHLNLLPEDVAETVITVGDPDRVTEITRHFDKVEFRKGKREFITHTGYLGKRRITVLSTGIGTDNIDIVLNELDALVNIDFNNRMVKQDLSSLNIIRIGTSGTIQPDIPVGTILASSFGLGLDALMNYYVHELSGDEHSLLDSIKTHFSHFKGISPYITAADGGLLQSIGKQMEQGITVTAPGFYAPQGRQVRAKSTIPNLINHLNTFRHTSNKITNLEMETAGIYALAKVLGHKALSVNAILANRLNFEFSTNPDMVVSKAIKMVLDQL